MTNANEQKQIVMKDIVFMVNTEYHLILSIGIMDRYFKDNYRITICRVSPIDGNRLNNVNFDNSSMEYVEILYDYSNPNRELKKRLDRIIAIKPAVFFFFLENKFWMNYLFSRLHDLGAKIILGPDGMKTYNNVAIPSRRVLRKMFSGLVFGMKTGLFSIPFVEKHYATSKYIDEVWVENATKFQYQGKKKVFEFNISVTPEFLRDLNAIFSTKESDFSLLKENAILYLDCPISSNGYYERVVNMLKQIQERHPTRKLAVKLHPRSSEIVKKMFNSLNNITFLKSQYPAELYIANAKDSLIVSVVSTSLLFFNPNCKYFWVYPVFNDICNYSRINNPTKHINVVHYISEI